MFIHAKTLIRKFVQKGMIINSRRNVCRLLRAMQYPHGKAIKIVINVAMKDVMIVRRVILRKTGSPR
jgi:hypothetical protein